jgi:hypothetical protein
LVASETEHLFPIASCKRSKTKQNKEEKREIKKEWEGERLKELMKEERRNVFYKTHLLPLRG